MESVYIQFTKYNKLYIKNVYIYSSIFNWSCVLEEQLLIWSYFSLGTSKCPLHSLVAHLRSPLLQKCPFSEVEMFLFFWSSSLKTTVTELSARSALWDGISPFAVKQLFINVVALLWCRFLGETVVLKVWIGVWSDVRILMQSYSIVCHGRRGKACVQVLMRPPGSFPKCSWARKMQEEVRPTYRQKSDKIQKSSENWLTQDLPMKVLEGGRHSWGLP